MSTNNDDAYKPFVPPKQRFQYVPARSYGLGNTTINFNEQKRAKRKLMKKLERSSGASKRAPPSQAKIKRDLERAINYNETKLMQKEDKH